MNSRFTKSALAVAGLAAVFLSAIASGIAQPAPAQSAATPASPHTPPAQPASGSTDAKTAEQVFKNIQVLKGIPSDQLQPAMQFIAASLGVECAFCHTQGAFDNDDKKPKLAARKMIQMQMAINKESFEGHTAVTCNSCHRGSHDPVAIPIISDEEPKPAAPAEGPNAAARPTADQILDKYIQAVGGAEALQKISSRVEKGKVNIRDRQLPVEIFAKAPDKRFTISHGPNGDSITATDGHIGWLANGDRPAQEMSEADNNVFKLDAAFRLPTDLKQIFTQFRVGRPDKVADKEVNQLIGIRQGQPPVRLFFDAQTGLLVRMVRYTETPLGRNPAQVDYADYRDSGGVKIPYQWTIARPAGRFTIKVDQVQDNVPIDDAKFTKPATPPPAPPVAQPKP
jgi:outer membrane lipoprotein-sorting protein